MAWVYLTVAGLLEIVWASAMKHSEGFTKLWPTMILLSISMKTLPLGTAYSVWTGIGVAGAFIFGIVVLHEEAGMGRILAAALIVSGLVLMKLMDNTA